MFNVDICRPAFLEEFERLEVELRRLYQDYITRFRCVSYLEQQLDDAEVAEHQRIELRQVNKNAKRCISNSHWKSQENIDDKFLNVIVDFFSNLDNVLFNLSWILEKISE